MYINNIPIPKLSISYSLNTGETYDGDLKFDKIYDPWHGTSLIGYTYTNKKGEIIQFFFQCFTSLKGDKCCLSGKCDQTYPPVS